MVANFEITRGILQMKTERYKIIETEIGPLISESRSTVYDVLEAKNNGKTLYEISMDNNLTPLQVQAAFDYIEKHHDTLQTTLNEIIEVAEERQKHYMAIAAERQKRPVPMTPERVAFYARLNQIKQRAVG